MAGVESLVSEVQRADSRELISVSDGVLRVGHRDPI